MKGPNSGIRLHNAFARQRSSILNKSLMIPAPRVKQPEPPIPAKDRRAIKESMLGASANPILNAMKAKLAAPRIGLLPNISLGGENARGPNCFSQIRQAEL